MLSAAVELFRARGYEGVGVAELLEKSGAPRGSLYFHFPGGKDELAVRLADVSAKEVPPLLGEILAFVDKHGVVDGQGRRVLSVRTHRSLDEDFVPLEIVERLGIHGDEVGVVADGGADRVSAEGYGELHAVADNGSAEGRAKNRRTALSVRQR